MAKKYILFIILNGILCGTSYVQTTLNIQSDVVISNAAATTLREGNLKVRGPLVVSEGYAPGLYSAGIAGGSAGGDYSMAVGRYSNAGDTGGIALGESADAMGNMQSHTDAARYHTGAAESPSGSLQRPILQKSSPWDIAQR